MQRRSILGFCAALLAAALGCGSSHSTGGTGAGGHGATTSSGGTGGAGGAGSASSASTGSGTGGGMQGPGTFVAVGYGGRRARSTDGAKTFTDDQSLMPNGGDDMALLRTVVTGPGQIVALGWRVMTSPDAASWTDHGTVIGQWIGAAVYAKGRYVAVGGYGLRATSDDGITWQDHSIDTIASHAHDGLVFGDVQGGRFVSANDDGQRAWSADGTAWTAGSGADGVNTKHLAFGNGVFVGVGDTAVVTSADGASWTTGATLAAAPGGIVFAEGHFTALADGHVLTSTDGMSWTDHDAPGVSAGGLAYGDGVYVTLGWQSWRRSTDGITWDPSSSAGSDNSFEWVTFAP